jgi:hypothetical protein
MAALRVKTWISESCIWMVGFRPKIELQWPKIQNPNPNFVRTQNFAGPSETRMLDRRKFGFWAN